MQVMYWELYEEMGLYLEYVKIIGCICDWLCYEVFDKFIKCEVCGYYCGQKQIWFLLWMVGCDCDICLCVIDYLEFDVWCWNEYWVLFDVVIEFKWDVYQLVLMELLCFLCCLVQ